MDDYKENDGTSLVTQSIYPLPASAVARPLSNKTSLNSLNDSNKTMTSKESLSPTRRKRGSTTPALAKHEQLSESLTALEADYSRLERQYTDILLKNSTLAGECQQLQIELQNKDTVITDQKDKLLNYEAYIKTTNEDYNRNKELLGKEVYFYKELITDLQLKVKKLKSEVSTLKKENTASSPQRTTPEPPHEDLKHILEISEKFNRLLIDFKVLQSNFELERNSRLVLIDQIELLTKENEILSNQTSSKNSLHQELDIDDDVADGSEIDSSVIHNLNIHTMNDLTDEDEPDSMLSYLADDLNASSPVKFEQNDLEEEPNKYDYSEEMMDNTFQFPGPNRNKGFPSPDPESVKSKRKSLPSKLRTSPKFESTEEFVLSPLKLAAHSSSFFDSDQKYPESVSRYSANKPTHSRYNSHDLFPIKVEFEGQHDKQVFEKIDETPGSDKVRSGYNGSARSSIRNSAFMALSGGIDGETPDSKRNSLTTNSSSKRSSLMMDLPPLDISKEEIMKLRFELQSLKLHNEKLLSYIGFEFQKQKKSIKKLSNKQSVRTLRALSHVSKQIEYSDAKLIEKSKEMLIHKKRVLRSVSINPILSKNYSATPFNRSASIGILNTNSPVFESELDNDEDDYGFLKQNDTFTKRIFSNGLQAYLNCDELDIDGIDEDSAESDSIKKYKSQTFSRKMEFVSSESEEEEENASEEIIEINKRSSEPECDEGSSSEEELGMLKQIKFLILGAGAMKHTHKKKKKEPELVDDGLKLKFLTISIGIIIIGLKLSHQSHQHPV